ncbi:MAG: SMC-Scp complex subunit ScpB [Candidatus Melainabacteria bacterium]
MEHLNPPEDETRDRTPGEENAPEIDLFADPDDSDNNDADTDDTETADVADILGKPLSDDVYATDEEDEPDDTESEAESLEPEPALSDSDDIAEPEDTPVTAEAELKAEPDTDPSDAEAVTDEDITDTVEAVLGALKGRIEAALFITNKALSLGEIAEIVEARPDDTEMALAELIQDYAFREHGALEIDDTDGYILQVRETAASVVNKMMPLEITPAILRTLSAIAIKSPILQSDLIELRGSTAYDHIGELLARKLISKKRQGRSYILKTTTAFYEYFKLKGDKKELMHLVAQFNPSASSAPVLPGDDDPYFAAETDSDADTSQSLDEAV